MTSTSSVGDRFNGTITAWINGTVGSVTWDVVWGLKLILHERGRAFAKCLFHRLGCASGREVQTEPAVMPTALQDTISQENLGISES